MLISEISSVLTRLLSLSKINRISFFWKAFVPFIKGCENLMKL